MFRKITYSCIVICLGVAMIGCPESAYDNDDRAFREDLFTVPLIFWLMEVSSYTLADNFDGTTTMKGLTPPGSVVKIIGKRI